MQVDTQLANTIRDVLRRDPPRTEPNPVVDTVTAGQLVTDDLRASDGTRQPKVTTGPISKGPPATPRDGDIWIASGVDSNGTRWQFQYNATSASVYKWEFIGGSASWSTISTDQSTTTVGSWLDLATPGPSLVLARAGDYLLEATANVYHSASPAMVELSISPGTLVPYSLGGGIAVASSADGIALYRHPQISIAAGQTVKVIYTTNTAGTAHWRDRYIYARPIRVA